MIDAATLADAVQKLVLAAPRAEQIGRCAMERLCMSSAWPDKSIAELLLEAAMAAMLAPHEPAA